MGAFPNYVLCRQQLLTASYQVSLLWDFSLVRPYPTEILPHHPICQTVYNPLIERPLLNHPPSLGKRERPWSNLGQNTPGFVSSTFCHRFMKQNIREKTSVYFKASYD